MRRRSRASSKLAKPRLRKAALKRRNARKAKQAPSRSASSAETKITQLTRERDEALEREKASAKVLRIISTSPGELKPIFQAMLENAVRICEAFFGNLYLRDADGFHMVAAHHDSPAYVAYERSTVAAPTGCAPRTPRNSPRRWYKSPISGRYRPATIHSWPPG
jgi:hypothetical protein